MSSNFLDKEGLATLWERIQRLVHECGKVTYKLESDGNMITLVGSDGSKSVVYVTATAECSGSNDEELIPVPGDVEIQPRPIITQ